MLHGIEAMLAVVPWGPTLDRARSNHGFLLFERPALSRVRLEGNEKLSDVLVSLFLVVLNFAM